SRRPRCRAPARWCSATSSGSRCTPWSSSRSRARWGSSAAPPTGCSMATTSAAGRAIWRPACRSSTDGLGRTTNAAAILGPRSIDLDEADVLGVHARPREQPGDIHAGEAFELDRDEALFERLLHIE